MRIVDIDRNYLFPLISIIQNLCQFYHYFYNQDQSKVSHHMNRIEAKLVEMKMERY